MPRIRNSTAPLPPRQGAKERTFSILNQLFSVSCSDDERDPFLPARKQRQGGGGGGRLRARGKQRQVNFEGELRHRMIPIFTLRSTLKRGSALDPFDFQFQVNFGGELGVEDAVDSSLRSGQEERKADMPIVDQARGRDSGLSVLEQRIKALEEGTTASLARIEQALIAIQALKTEK